MKRSEIRTFLKNGVNALTPVPEFGSGRLSEFASKLDHTYPAVWQVVRPVDVELLASGGGSPLDNWDIELVVAQKDTMDSMPAQYEELIDAADFIAQKLIYQYRNATSGYKMLHIHSIKREPFVKKKTPDVCTGVMLTFTLTSNDKTNVC